MPLFLFKFELNKPTIFFKHLKFGVKLNVHLKERPIRLVFFIQAIHAVCHYCVCLSLVVLHWIKVIILINLPALQMQNVLLKRIGQRFVDFLKSFSGDTEKLELLVSINANEGLGHSLILVVLR